MAKDRFNKIHVKPDRKRRSKTQKTKVGFIIRYTVYLINLVDYTMDSE